MLVALASVLALTACGGSDSPSAADQPDAPEKSSLSLEERGLQPGDFDGVPILSFSDFQPAVPGTAEQWISEKGGAEALGPELSEGLVRVLDSDLNFDAPFGQRYGVYEFSSPEALEKYQGTQPKHDAVNDIPSSDLYVEGPLISVTFTDGRFLYYVANNTLDPDEEPLRTPYVEIARNWFERVVGAPVSETEGPSGSSSTDSAATSSPLPSGNDEGQIIDVSRRYIAAALAQNGEEACGYFSPAGLQDVVQKFGDCAPTIEAFGAAIAQIDGSNPEVRVEAIRVDGDHATATVTVGASGSPDPQTYDRVDGKWLIGVEPE